MRIGPQFRYKLTEWQRQCLGSVLPECGEKMALALRELGR
jgi:hypothetical protein